MMQNSGLGNAVSPLTSLTWTFRLPQVLIVTWRAQPGIADEPQHALMGPITPDMLKIMEIPWELFPTETAQIGPALDRAVAHMDQSGRPYALIMEKGSVGAYPLKPGMPLALGLALARPDLRVIALDGDGAALMRLGVFATGGAYGPANLWHLLLDNGVYDSTGGQATVSPRVSCAAMAAACGYASSLETNALDQISGWLNERPLDGARFARLFIRPGTPDDLPRPSVTPAAVKTRLMQHIGAPSGVH
jgi:hypothetical protein